MEDDDAIRKLGKTILEKSGYRVLAAGTAEEARALFSDEAVDMLITDMVLPKASGLDLARELRSSGSDLRVMFVSGYTENSFGEHRTVSPVFLEKPFHVEALLAKTREALRVGTAGGTPDPE